MIKNYLSNVLGYIKQTFVKNLLYLWILIILQIVTIIPAIILFNMYNIQTAPWYLFIAFILVVSVFLTSFFFMFKKIYNCASYFLKKDNLSNFKIIKSILTLGVFNITPFLLFSIIAKNIPYNPALNLVLFILTVIFYISMSLSLAGIVFWQEKNSTFAVLNSLKLFFKKFLIAFPVFLLFYITGYLITFVLFVILNTALLLSGYFTNFLGEILYNILIIYPLYFIAPFYIGAQAAIIDKYGNNS